MMVDFSEFPQYILSQFIIEEKQMEDGHRLYLIKKKESSYIWLKKYRTGDIPHKYQQNNTLIEAQESIKQYLIQELGINPNPDLRHKESSWRKFFRLISQ